MNQIRSILVIVLLCNCNNNSNTTNREEALSDSGNNASLMTDSGIYKKEDLKKIKWIEGKWKGLYNGQPFYEIYQMINDSTIEITSFDWNGKDSSNTSRSYVTWQDGFYYLGKEKNYKTVSISEKEIVMKKNNKANNDVTWRWRDETGWDAILEHAKGSTQYHMEKFNGLK